MTDVTKVGELSKPTAYGSTYKRLGLLLLVAYAVMQSAAFYLYFHPPVNAWALVDNVTALLPQLGGLKKLLRFSSIGDRLALVLTLAYIPGVTLGVLMTLLELKLGKWRIKIGLARTIASLAFTAALVAFLHYWPYWAGPRRDRISIMHPLIAFAGPLLIGIFTTLMIAALIAVLRQSTEKK